jgi:hypothetical protein
MIQTARSKLWAGYFSSDHGSGVIFTENLTFFLEAFYSEAHFPFHCLFEAGFSPIGIKPCWTRVSAQKIVSVMGPEIAIYVLFLTAEIFAE